MNKKDIGASPYVIEGTLILNNHVNVLTDLGSTHSIACHKFFSKLNVSPITMPHVLVVSTSVRKIMLSDQVYESCVVSIEGHKLP